MSQTVSIIDDDPAVLDALTMLMKSHGLNVARFDTARAFLDAGMQPGCIVSDVRMPGMTGIELLRTMKQSGDDRPVILITGHGDIEMAVQAIKLGAREFIEKPFDNSKLIDCVNDALQATVSILIENQEHKELSERFAMLTERQRETMRCLIRGMANKQIAAELGISPRTVEIHRTWVMNKMAAKTLADLVRKGLALGLR
ncbi:MAG: response regulator [Hyphomicrobium sp.]|jgi:two-component system response regulator FixJ|nr:response regulator transcription factor [Hyphomicrobium sp.]